MLCRLMQVYEPLDCTNQFDELQSEMTGLSPMLVRGHS